jgi:hypothetical protein
MDRAFLAWFNELPAKVQDKCYLLLQRLGEMGHELRRPEADILRDGIYELRVSLRGVHHQIRLGTLPRGLTWQSDRNPRTTQ